jgi:hypothetical protein
MFGACYSLTNATIPDSVTSIGVEAFSYSRLTSVTIPNDVTNIGDGAFRQCGALTNIDVSADNPSYASADGVLFNKSMTTLEAFPAGLGGGYTIPNGVTNIGNEAFFNCGGLTNVIIPNTVTSIGMEAFYAESLAKVTIPNSVTSISDYAFYLCENLTNVTIGTGLTSIGSYAFGQCFLTGIYFQGNAPTPTNDTSVFQSDTHAIAYYFQGTTGWGATFDGIPTVSLTPPPAPPAIAISTYVSQPAVFFPTATGTNYVLQMSTNLASGNWVTVSNGIPISGLIITNPPAAAFFRLH